MYERVHLVLWGYTVEPCCCSPYLRRKYVDKDIVYMWKLQSAAHTSRIGRQIDKAAQLAILRVSLNL